jgi:hypothetical protein
MECISKRMAWLIAGAFLLFIILQTIVRWSYR